MSDKTEKTRIQLTDIKVAYREGAADFDEQAVRKAEAYISKRLGVRPTDTHIAKKSIDARRGITFVYTVSAEVGVKPEKIKDKDIRVFTRGGLTLTRGVEKMAHRPVIAGFGPAGMFAALLLAENGYAPIVLERGAAVGERVRAVERFVRDGVLDTETNIQFGAGGAGTFSDGKLTTRIGDPLAAYVIEKLAELGAPGDILYKAKPHIGTDVLRAVVENFDERIRSLGGEIRYNTKAENIRDGRLTAGGDEIEYDALVLAIGHSARDTYAELIAGDYFLEAKPFSVGVRAEHLQDDIDRALFGVHAGDKSLGKGEYQLSFRKGERGCYTFCMCPGGTVVPSASEIGGVVTNGMSTRARDGRNANAAVCVSVLPKDFGGDASRAIEFQRNLERAAFEAGGGDYYAPMQTVGDLMDKKSGTGYSKIVPTYRGGMVRAADFDKILPPFVTEMMREGLADFGKKIRGYDESCVPLTGVETRTSAPVRILRGDDCTALGKRTIYPCGEGAGYAGGIVSAGVDGIRVARAIIARFAPKE